MSQLQNVSVQILPAGVHVGRQGAFIIAEVNGTAASVFIEDASDGRTTDDAEMVNKLSVRFRWLQTIAMTPAESLVMMERFANEHLAHVELQRRFRQQLC